MKPKSYVIVLVALAASFFAPNQPATAADAPLQLKPSPAIAKNIAAFPRLVAAPDDKAAPRINTALDKRDASARQMQKECRDNVQSPADFGFRAHHLQ